MHAFGFRFVTLSAIIDLCSSGGMNTSVRMTSSNTALTFADAPRLVSAPIRTDLDSRHDYAEDRFIGLGLLDNRMAAVAFTETDEESKRVPRTLAKGGYQLLWRQSVTQKRSTIISWSARPMPIFNPLAEFEMLIPDFARRHQEAQDLTRNAFVSIAQAGFTLHEQPSRWGTYQENFLLGARAGDYSDESLGWYDEAAPVMASFACLALGMLLGLQSRGQIDDTEFLHGLALLPAALLEHNKALGYIA